MKISKELKEQLQRLVDTQILYQDSNEDEISEKVMQELNKLITINLIR